MFVMVAIAVLSIVAASLLITNMTRYQTTFQSASWQESIVASEAGIDLAMNEFRKRVVSGPIASFQTNWTVTSPQTGQPYPNYGRAFPANNQPYQLASHSGEGNNTMQVRVFVDVPGCDGSPAGNFAQPNDNSYISQVDNPALRDPDGVDRSRWLFRMKSLGIANLSGPARPNLNKYDNELRRFSFFHDWRTGQAVPLPQTARLVEAIASPETGFRNALMADKQINLSNVDVLIDSYNSSQGLYSNPGNCGQAGNIATNGQLINANNATVDGNALTNNGTVSGAGNVTGQQSSNFYQELTPLTTASLNPAWSTVPDGGVISGSASYSASTDPNNPAMVRLDGINLPDGGNIINIAAPVTANSNGTTNTLPGYLKLYVQGDIQTAGASFVNIDPNVSVIVYFTGNINLQGYGIINNSFLASHLVLNGLQPPPNADGSLPTRSIGVSTTQDFEGIIYAPNHDLDLALVAASASSSDPGLIGALTGTVVTVVASLQSQIDSLQSQLAAAEATYTSDASKPGVGNLNKSQSELGTIASEQSRLNQLTQDAQVLASTVIPTSSAQDHARGYNGIYGAFVANTITVNNKTHVHYDETLRNEGPVNHYQIINWFEDNVGRDAVGGTESFWWPGSH